jgi:GNAT superfamily N-acetyltransferase
VKVRTRSDSLTTIEFDPAESVRTTTLQGVVDEVRAARAKRIEARVRTNEPNGAHHRAALRETGFTMTGERLHLCVSMEDAIASYRATPSTVHWAAPPETPHGTNSVVTLLQHVSTGDPGGVFGSDAEAFLRQLVHDTLPEHRSAIVQVGHVNATPAALVLLSINATTGVGGFFYLGVAPTQRRQGLAREAMRHGLTTMRKLGVTTYVDGTSANNAPALALLRTMGPLDPIEEWSVDL